jgi:hypothetical protein
VLLLWAKLPFLRRAERAASFSNLRTKYLDGNAWIISLLAFAFLRLRHNKIEKIITLASSSHT